MMRALVLTIPILVTFAPFAAAAGHATVYEASEMTPENMDYDKANKTFRAHSGWLNDKLVHYYKFRMYTPMTYPMHIPMNGTPTVPVMPLYMASTNGTVAGIVSGQDPILRHAHMDGENYSDFVEIVLFRVTNGYTPNLHRSWRDLERANVNLTRTGIIVNAPLVPMGSKLEAPEGGIAPIKPVEAWYDETQVQLFYFETTSPEFAAKFNPLTRNGTAASAGSGFEMTVSDFARNDSVRFIPIWHFNQYAASMPEQGGGPDHKGQRNIIGLDRLDRGYSPLWQVAWVSKLPHGYTTSQASHPDQVTEANGFSVMMTPMFVNCPNIGPHGGGANNTLKATNFTVRPTAPPGGEVHLVGALVMEAGKNVTAKMGEKTLGTATTGMMGAYRIPVKTDDLATGENTLMVMGPSGATVGTFTVTKAGATPTGAPSPTPTPTEATEDDADAPGLPVVAILAATALVAWSVRRRR